MNFTLLDDTDVSQAYAAHLRGLRERAKLSRTAIPPNGCRSAKGSFWNYFIDTSLPNWPILDGARIGCTFKQRNLNSCAP